MVGATILIAVLTVQTGVQEPGPVDFGPLIELYEKYELPMPPEGAEPVLVPNGTHNRVKMFAVGFKFSAEGPDRCLFGVRSTELRSYMKPVPFQSADQVELYQLEGLVWSDDPRLPYYAENILATAIQLAILGEDEQAQKLVQLNDSASMNRFKRSLGSGDNRHFAAPEDATLEQRVVYLALHYNLNRWSEPDADRSAVAETVGSLVTDLSLDQDPYRTELLAGMWKAAADPPLRDDKVIELIDALRDVRFYRFDRDNLGPGADGYEGDAELIAMGDEALPVLADYIDDPRWTKVSHSGVTNTYSRYETVGELVRSIVVNIAREAFDVPRRQVTRSAVLGYLEWQRTERRELFLRSLIVSEKPRDWSGWPGYPDSEAAEELLRSYPDVFEDAYLEIVEHRRHINPQLLTDLVVEKSGWPDERKRALLAKAARSAPLPQSLGPLIALRQFDGPEYQALLTDKLDELPLGWFDSDFVWGTPEMGAWSAPDLALEILEHGEPETRAALTAKTEKVRPELRAWMLYGTLGSMRYESFKSKSSAYSFILHFLDDTSVPEFEESAWDYFRWTDVSGRSIRDLLTYELYGPFFKTDRGDYDMSKAGFAKMRSEVRRKLVEEIDRLAG